MGKQKVKPEPLFTDWNEYDRYIKWYIEKYGTQDIRYGNDRLLKEFRNEQSKKK